MTRRVIGIALAFALLAGQAASAGQPSCLMGRGQGTMISAACCCSGDGAAPACGELCAGASPEPNVSVREAASPASGLSTPLLHVAAWTANPLLELPTGLPPTHSGQVIPKRYLRARVLRL